MHELTLLAAPAMSEDSSEEAAMATLVAAVRTEFRTNPLIPPKGHPLTSEGPCSVAGCDRDGERKPCVCRAHYIAWTLGPRKQGVTLQDWVATDPRPIKSDRYLLSCRVEACRFGRVSHGFCIRHMRAWHRADRPEPAEFAATCTVRWPYHHRLECYVIGCTLLREGRKGNKFCAPHRSRYQRYAHRHQDMTPERFQQLVADFGQPKIRLDGLSPRMQLEIQSAAQAYFDRGQHKTRINVWGSWVKIIASSGANSLLDHPLQYWLERADRNNGANTNAVRLFRWAWDEVDQLVNGTGWDSEYSRDIWRVHRLGIAEFPNQQCHLRFDRISQPWLQGLAKRWIRHRIVTGRALQTVTANLRMLDLLSAYLEGVDKASAGPHRFTRSVVEGFLADLARTNMLAKSRCGRISELRIFLRDVHQRDWAPMLPNSCVVYPDDSPRRIDNSATARALPEVVMQQIEEGLPTFGDATTRLALELLMRCGLRSKDALGLAWDCLVRDGDNHPYVRYLNHKMARTAFVPVDEDLATRIQLQQQVVITQYPDNPVRLFPALKENADGQRPFNAVTLRDRFNDWLRTAQITDEHGRPAKVTLHQFRHTFGTRLINNDVPQHIVQQLLDHQSPEMTAHYARLRNSTIREAWAKARKINIHGDEVTLPDDHPLAEAAWLRAGLNTAKQTLPNGYCGMPAHSPCEHANPCLACPLFLTTPDFLPQHQAQHRTTLTLIETARRDGHHRVVEKNEEVVRNLERIITACQSCDTTQVVAGGKIITPGVVDDIGEHGGP